MVVFPFAEIIKNKLTFTTTIHKSQTILDNFQKFLKNPLFIRINKDCLHSFHIGTFFLQGSSSISEEAPLGKRGLN